MQSFPTSAEIIHNTLAADSTFVATLGEYTFKDATVEPAISIITPGERVPYVSDITGIECVILDVPNIRRRNYLTEAADLEKVYRLFVIAWDPATGSDVDQSVSRILSIFSGASSFDTVKTSEGLNAKVQTVVTIPSNSPILL